MQFPHEKLNVYNKSLNVKGKIESFISAWDVKYAYIDHLQRASESIIINLVEAVRLRSSDQKKHYLDFSSGSVLECAACIDLALLTDMLQKDKAIKLKIELLEIIKMLFGLRKSWNNPQLEEPGSEYHTTSSKTPEDAIFSHETLNAYKLSLRFYKWFLDNEKSLNQYKQFIKIIDRNATCIVLNIAESNGRFSSKEQKNFLDISNSAVTKLAAHLDIGQTKKIISENMCKEGKTVLVEIGALTANRDYLK